MMVIMTTLFGGWLLWWRYIWWWWWQLCLVDDYGDDTCNGDGDDGDAGPVDMDKWESEEDPRKKEQKAASRWRWAYTPPFTMIKYSLTRKVKGNQTHSILESNWYCLWHNIKTSWFYVDVPWATEEFVFVWEVCLVWYKPPLTMITYSLTGKMRGKTSWLYMDVPWATEEFALFGRCVWFGTHHLLQWSHIH